MHRLFGTAVKCGRPDCPELLYRQEDGLSTLNCRIAHIRASAPNGPRADPLMTCQEVNALENLMLLCPFHADQIDNAWGEYPPELLYEWKHQQVEQATSLGVARQPTDDEIIRLFVASRERDLVSRSAAVELARVARRLRSAAERTRVEPAQIEQERQQAVRRANQGIMAFDPETGERLQASLSRQDEQAFRRRIEEALRRSHIEVQAAADAVVEQAAGVAAATGRSAAEAHDWLERVVVAVVRTAGAWPDELAPVLNELDAAAAALRDVAAGRTVAVPPPPEPAPPEPRSPFEVFARQCSEVSERAARHLRVDHLASDTDLHAAVLAVALDCASIPTAVSLMQLGLDHNAALAAAVLKNADAEQFTRAVAAASGLQPEAAAAAHLRHLHLLADERGWSVRAAMARDALNTLGARIIKACAASGFWERNIEHGSLVLRAADAAMGRDAVFTAIRKALNDADLIEPILMALAETVEQRDSFTMAFDGIRRQYSEPDRPFVSLPECVPVDAMCEVISRRWPDGPRLGGSEVERLAAEFHQYRCWA